MKRKKIIIIGIAILLCFILLKAVWMFVFLSHAETLLINQEKKNILSRRQYLIEKVYGGEVRPNEMPSSLHPQIQGEWAMGTYSMTAIALANIAFLYPETREESLQVIESIIEQSQLPEIRKFDHWRWQEDALDTLENNRGHIGYLAHLNLILASYHFIGGSEQKYTEFFREISLSLKARLESSPILLAETYPHAIFVPDNIATVASLALAEKYFDGDVEFDGFSEKWLSSVIKKFRDPDTNLLVFTVSPEGKSLQKTRGIGSTWNSFFLFYIDPDVAQNNFGTVKKLLKKSFMGLTGIREYHDGRFSLGDVDSGPLIFGISPAATGFAIAGARFTEDQEFLDDLLFTSELIGFSYQWNGKRNYLVAPLVGDAIMLASMTITKWDAVYTKKIKR